MHMPTNRTIYSIVIWKRNLKSTVPKVVQIGQVQYWMVEGKLLPRPVGNFGHGTPNGYLFKRGKPDMAINSPGLDDVQGRLKDLDKEGIDIQVVLSEHHGHGFPPG